MTADQKSWVVSIGFVGMAIGAICSGDWLTGLGVKQSLLQRWSFIAWPRQPALCTESDLAAGLPFYCRFGPGWPVTRGCDAGQ